MARARNIKPGFYKNEDLAECSVWSRLLFPGLWMMADREGRMEDRPKRIKAEILPFDSVDVEPLLRELTVRSFIVRYQIDGVSYIQISKFGTHQTPHYSEKPSVIKPPPLQEKPPDIERPNSGKRMLIKRGAQPPDCLNPDSLNPESLETHCPTAVGRFPEFWARWPKNERKQDRCKCLERWKSGNFDVIADRILADVSVKQQTQKWQGGFIEAPLVYLNRKRWEDGVTPDSVTNGFDYEKIAREVEGQTA